MATGTPTQHEHRGRDPGRAVTRPLPRGERRDAILRGAATAFARAGYAATSMEDIATASGITKLIVYRHFDSKEELYRAVLERVFDRQAELFLGGLAGGLAPGTSARALLTVAREYPDGFRLLWRHSAREPQFVTYADELRDHAVGAARSVVAEAAPGVPTEWAAQTLFDVLVDAVLNWLDHGDPERDDELVAHATALLAGTVGAWAESG